MQPLIIWRGREKSDILTGIFDAQMDSMSPKYTLLLSFRMAALIWKRIPLRTPARMDGGRRAACSGKLHVRWHAPKNWSSSRFVRLVDNLRSLTEFVGFAASGSSLGSDPRQEHPQYEHYQVISTAQSQHQGADG